MNNHDDEKSSDSTATDDDSVLPIDIAAEWAYSTIGIGEVTGDLDAYADYEHAKVDVDRLTELLDVAEVFGWDHVHLALCDEVPVVVQNADADDKPTLILAPRVEPQSRPGDLSDE